MIATMATALPPSTSEGSSLTIEPRTDAQSVALRSLEPEFCYSGRRFGGKSWIACAKALLYGAYYPGARVAVCREERASMESTTLLTMRSEICPQAVWAECWREGKSTLFLPNGSEIIFFGLDRPGRALGGRYGFGAVDQAEQLSYEQFVIFNSCQMQVGMPWHQTMLLFNPENPEHWAYKRYRPDDGDGVRTDDTGRVFARVAHVQPDDLMEFLSAESQARLDGMDGVWRLRLRLGIWAAFEGSVYGDLWANGLHVVEPPPEWARWGGYPPPTWPRYRAADFGLTNPFCLQWWAESPDGAYFMYREIYRTGRITEDHARHAAQLEADELATLQACARAEGAGRELDAYLGSLYVRMGVSDPAGPDQRMTLARHGISTIAGSNDILAGIETVRHLLRNGLGGPRIRLVRGALVERDPALAALANKPPTCTAEEFPGYRWQKDRNTGAAQGPRDLPIDSNNHGLAALRYLFHTLASAPRPQVIG